MYAYYIDISQGSVETHLPCTRQKYSATFLWPTVYRSCLSVQHLYGS